MIFFNCFRKKIDSILLIRRVGTSLLKSFFIIFLYIIFFSILSFNIKLVKNYDAYFFFMFFHLRGNLGLATLVAVLQGLARLIWVFFLMYFFSILSFNTKLVEI